MDHSTPQRRVSDDPRYATVRRLVDEDKLDEAQALEMRISDEIAAQSVPPEYACGPTCHGWCILDDRGRPCHDASYGPCSICEPRVDAEERFTLGTLATYPNGAPLDGELSAAVLDEKTGKVYPFGRWDAAKNAIAQMRAADSPLFYFAALAPRDGFTPAEPGVDEGRAS